LAAAHAEARAAYRRLLGSSSPREACDAETFAKVLTVHDALVQATTPWAEPHALADATVQALLSYPGAAWLERLVRTGCGLLRDLFGNPFRPVKVDAAWLRSRRASVAAVAAGIYAGRNFEELPVLADALLEADCPSAEMVLHCRTPAAHGRGCWVVDALRGRE
jgi:hypothetical protein